MAKKRRSQDQLEEIDALVERLREFVRLSYMTAAEVARRMGVRDSAVYSWLQRESRPTKPEVISAFLKSVPTENGSGITPTGYEYREYKNWRGIPKSRRCPFCKKGKGEIRRRRGFCGSLSKLRGQRTEAGELRRGASSVERERNCFGRVKKSALKSI
jgi:hypothetical protein